MGHLDILFKVTELFIEFTLLTGYLKNNLHIGASFLQGRCMTTKSRSSLKIGHLDLLFKVIAIYRIFLLTGYLMTNLR